MTVRVNSLESSVGLADIEAVRDFVLGGTATCLRTVPHAVVLPKVESAETVRKCVELLGAAESVAVWAMIETPLGVLHVDTIASSHCRLQCLVAGTADLTKDLHALHTVDRMPMLYSLQRIVLAARAFGITALDGVHLNLSDDSGFMASCNQGRQMGFDGKTLIHPKTIAAANDAFSPSEAELEFSRRVIEAHQQALASGSGVVVVDGRLVENLHVHDAIRIQAIQQQINQLTRNDGQ